MAKYGKKAQKTVKSAMKKYKKGKLKSGKAGVYSAHPTIDQIEYLAQSLLKSPQKLIHSLSYCITFTL